MLSKILVPLDGSATAEKILEVLSPIAKRSESKIVLATAIWSPAAVALPGLVNDELDRLDREARLYLGTVVAALKARGIEAEIHTRLGPPADAIVAMTKAEGASLVAMTTHGRTGVARLLLGSVAEDVIRHSSVPVLAVRSFPTEEGKENVAARLPRRILVPLDGTEAASHVAHFVIAMAKLLRAKIELLRVASPPHLAKPTAAAHFEFDVKAFAAHGIEVEQHVRHSVHPVDAILTCAQQLDCDLVAMATHGYSGLSRLVMGSVAESVLRRSNVPVLVLRHGPHDLRGWTPSERELAGSSRYLIGGA